MAKLEPGVCSPDVLALQKVLNQVLGTGAVKENGEYDDATMNAVGELQKRLGIGQTGVADGATLKALKAAMVPKTQVTINGVTAWVTKEELAKLKAAAGAKAATAIEQSYVNMANEARNLWNAHDKTRKDNWFWSSAVDLAVGCKFPDKGVIDRAIAAANSMKADAAAGRLDPNSLGSRSDPIRAAFAAMDQYREELFGGGEQLVKNLETIRDGCVITLQITSAIATGGASWQIQVGAAAALGGYEALLSEVSKAATDPKVTVGSAALNVFKGATVDAAVAYVMKGGGKGLENVADDIAKKAIEKAGSAGAKDALKRYAIRAVNGAAKQGAEDAMKGVANIGDPKASTKPEDLVKAAAESLVKGAGLGVLGPAMEKFGGKGASGLFSQSDLKALGKIDFDKAGSKGIEVAIDKAALPAAKKVLDGWGPDKNHANFEKEVKAAILDDPGVRAAAKKAEDEAKRSK